MCNVRIGFLFMEKYSGIKTVNASLVLDYEYIQMLRDADRKIPNPNKIIAQGYKSVFFPFTSIWKLLCNKPESVAFSAFGVQAAINRAATAHTHNFFILLLFSGTDYTDNTV